VYGEIGVGVNPHVDHSGGVVFVTVAAGAGLTIGGDGGFQLGFYTQVPSNIGGSAAGVEFGLSYYGGLAVGLWRTSSHGDWAITFSLVTGIDVTASAAISYTYILIDATTTGPTAQEPAAHFLILTRIECVNISGGDGDNNEVYFQFVPDGGSTYRFPWTSYFAMAEGDTWYCGRSVMFNDSVVVTLYDQDDFGDTNLGHTSISLSQVNTTSETQFTVSSTGGIFDDRLYYVYAKLVY
jgi:hypothetical protein